MGKIPTPFAAFFDGALLFPDEIQVITRNNYNYEIIDAITIVCDVPVEEFLLQLGVRTLDDMGIL